MWDELPSPWQACLELAWQAYCDDCYPIGAVVTDADGTILARGRNRIYHQRPADWDNRGAELAHAEVEALQGLDYAAASPNRCILYTTTEPCPMCLGAFYMSGVRTLHYASREPWAGSTDLLGKTWYLSRKPIRVHGPPDPRLELLVMALFVEKDLRQHGGRLPGSEGQKPWGGVYGRWAAVVPASLPAGQALYEKGVLAGLQRRAAAAAEMVTAAAQVIHTFLS